MNNVAVVTAFTPDFLDQFEIFVTSLRKHSKIPLIAVILDDKHSIDLNQFDCVEERLEPTQLSEYKSINDNHWMQWFKPHIIKFVSEKRNLDYVLWLDTDIVILNDIKPIILNILDQFTIMRDYFDPLTTLNDQKLYDLMPSTNELPELPLNSGVVGMSMPRDNIILDNWIDKCNIAINNPPIKECIKLFDQGALLWALKEMNLLHLILDRPEWNHNPIRNGYNILPEKVWPFGPKPMGGDLYAQILYDNPGNTIVAHYASFPKITNLLEINHPRAINYIKRYQQVHNVSRKRLFVVGLERAGTHSIAEIIRKSSKHPNWVRHESDIDDYQQNELLCKSALNKYRGQDYDFDAISRRIDKYNRSDVCLICDSNHRLAFFVDELKKSMPDSQFVLMLRSPIKLLKSRLFNFCVWPNYLYQYPLHYQMQLYNMHTHFQDGSAYQNQYRLYPKHIINPLEWQDDILVKYVWEITQTIDYTMQLFSSLPGKDYLILWLDNLTDEIHKLKNFIGQQYLDDRIVSSFTKRKFGSCKQPATDLRMWVDDLIEKNVDYILSQFESTLNKHGLEYPDITII